MSFSLLKAARTSAVTCSNHCLFWSKHVTIDASALLTVSEPAKIKILCNLISTCVCQYSIEEGCESCVLLPHADQTAIRSCFGRRHCSTT